MNARKPPEGPPQFELFCKFLDESESFCLGFEAGRIAQRMFAGETPISDPIPIHTANAEQIRLLADSMGYDADIQELAPEHAGWSGYCLTRRTQVSPKPTRGHLKVV